MPLSKMILFLKNHDDQTIPNHTIYFTFLAFIFLLSLLHVTRNGYFQLYDMDPITAEPILKPHLNVYLILYEL